MQPPGYFPDATDIAYLDAIARPLHPVLAQIEQQAEPDRVPIVDRASGRVLATLAAHRRRIVEVGTAIGYSTLWMALAQPHRGTIVTIDPDRKRTDQARANWRAAGVPDERIVVINRPALEAMADEDEVDLQGPFDLAFLDAIKEEYAAYFDALVPRLATGSVLVADNVLWSGAVAGRSDTHRDLGGSDTAALRSFDERVLRDPRFEATILPVGDGLLVAALRS